MSVVGGSEGSPASSEFRGVQALRGVAASMVVVYHATQLWSEHVACGADGLVWGNGRAGVDIFFVISGLVMTVSSGSKRAGAHPARRFLERRLVRIAPLYWLITGVFLLKVFAEHLHPEFANGTRHVAITFPYLVCSLLFVPFRNSLGDVQPPLIVGWTLSFEMFFYLLFAAALGLGVRAVALLTPLLLLLGAAGLFRKDGWPAVTVLASPLLLEFLAGVLIGWALEKGVRLKVAAASLLVSLGLLVIVAAPRPEAERWSWMVPAVAATAIVLGSVMLEERLGRFLPGWALRIGDASYSLYLSHLLVFSAVARLLMRMHLLVPGVVRRRDEILVVGLLVALSIAVSLVIYRLLEAPMDNALRRGLRLREARVQRTEVTGLPAV